jgi:hypothetical protein
MSLQNITSDTCLSALKEASDDQLCNMTIISELKKLSDMAAAWAVVFQFCIENGMPTGGGANSGIERVITFLESMKTPIE